MPSDDLSADAEDLGPGACGEPRHADGPAIAWTQEEWQAEDTGAAPRMSIDAKTDSCHLAGGKACLTLEGEEALLFNYELVGMEGWETCGEGCGIVFGYGAFLDVQDLDLTQSWQATLGLVDAYGRAGATATFALPSPG